MSLADQVFAIYKGLDPEWHKLFDRCGFDAIPDCDQFSKPRRDKDKENEKDYPHPGFEDFAGGLKAKFIEPGKPASSFFFHALASPSVTVPGLPPQQYPKEEDLETIENFVFAMAKRSLSDVRQLAENAPLGIVVFTKQYRVARETTHGRHADLVFSRTGIARVGSEGPASKDDVDKLRYDGALRCFSPVGSAPDQMPILPCRYSAYIAARVQGNEAQMIPGRFVEGDKLNQFWLPVHKLFNGDECLIDVSGLQVVLSQGHVNEKLRRIHRAFHILGHKSGYNEPEISSKPFVTRDDEIITAFIEHACGGSALLVPRNKIVEQVKDDKGNPVTIQVFPSLENTDASLRLFPRPLRWAPEFVHVRSMLDNGKIVNLNDRIDVASFVQKGGYQAIHYRDFTGDGWIRATCPQLAKHVPASIAAYSIVGPPDLMPNLRQSDLTDWYQSAPEDLKRDLWAGSSPIPLCDKRVAPNVDLPGGMFQDKDITAVCLVGMVQTLPKSTLKRPLDVEGRTTTLPDASSGIFAPGSDIGQDESPARVDENGQRIEIRKFLSNYGMGSPFLEDTKLCAAQSAFWPGTTPDTARVYEPFSAQPTVTPLLDSELPWDGSTTPQIISDPTPEAAGEVSHRSRAHADYINLTATGVTAFAGANFRLMHSIGTKEYVHRTITMARVYQALGNALVFSRSRWVVQSFLRVELSTVQRDIRDVGANLGYAPPQRSVPDQVTGTDVLNAMTKFQESSYRFVLYKPVGKRPGTVGQFIVSFFDIVRIYANATDVYIKRDGYWEHHRF